MSVFTVYIDYGNAKLTNQGEFEKFFAEGVTIAY